MQADIIGLAQTRKQFRPFPSRGWVWTPDYMGWDNKLKLKIICVVFFVDFTSEIVQWLAGQSRVCDVGLCQVWSPRPASHSVPGFGQVSVHRWEAASTLQQGGCVEVCGDCEGDQQQLSLQGSVLEIPVTCRTCNVVVVFAEVSVADWDSHYYGLL